MYAMRYGRFILRSGVPVCSFLFIGFLNLVCCVSNGMATGALASPEPVVRTLGISEPIADKETGRLYLTIGQSRPKIEETAIVDDFVVVASAILEVLGKGGLLV